MAGIFGFFNHSKPGKGVDPDAPPKRAFFRFMELYWRKFSRLIFFNFLFFVITLPLVLFLFMQYDTAVLQIIPDLQPGDALTGMILPTFFITLAGSLPAFMPPLLLVISMVLYGPALCGLSFVLRSFYREEHVWNADFFIKMKENFLQGMLMGLIELGAFFFIFSNILMELSEELPDSVALFFVVVRLLSYFFLFLLLMMRGYFYTMIVTFRLKTSAILKNALIFAFTGLLRNMGVLLLEGILLLLLLVVPLYDVLVFPLFYFSLTGFVTMFACYPLIRKHMIDPFVNKDDKDDKDDIDPVDRVDPRLLMTENREQRTENR